MIIKLDTASLSVEELARLLGAGLEAGPEPERTDVLLALAEKVLVHEGRAAFDPPSE